MNDKYSTTEGKTSEKLSDEAMLSAQWKNIDWHKAEREVNRLQIRIVKATQQKDYNAVKRLQYLLTHSFYAKALAVKRVVTNDGRRTPGVDGVLWNTPAKKMAAVLSLTDKGYRARPLRRVYIEKKDKKKKRPLGIPTMYDRAMQALYALALEPVAETTADGKSFGFRKGRCAQDACEYLFNALSRKHISPKWVLEGDIKGCFDHISHDWLLANIPMDKNILKQFLKAGFIYQRELFPTEEGTPQGGIISPILANMTLDGIEKKLVERFHTNALGKVDHEQWKSRKKLMGASWQKNLEKKGSKYAQSLLDLRGNDFIICNDYGFPINPDSYAALVRRVGKKAGIEKIHPHMFRHTFVSILLSNPNIGVATVAAEAGHAQPSTTLAIYTQVYDRRRDEIRKQMSMELYK